MKKVAIDCLSVANSLEVFDRVNDLISSGENANIFEMSDMTFRLFKGRPDRVCIENLITHRIGSEVKGRGFFGRARSEEKYVRFWNPYAYYETAALRDGVDGTVMGMFEAFLNEVDLNATAYINGWETLSRLQNALVGALSAEAMAAVGNNENQFHANGLRYEIIPAHDGDPQVFLAESDWEGGYDRCMSIFFRSSNVFNINGAHDSTYATFRPDDIWSGGKILS